MAPLKNIAAITLLLLCGVAKAQKNPLYTYQQLSGVYYATQKDSLKKAWVCPDVYSEKATQKKYREIWDGRRNL